MSLVCSDEGDDEVSWIAVGPEAVDFEVVETLVVVLMMESKTAPLELLAWVV